MSSLKLGQVAELTERVRARLAEFGEDVFDLPSLGVIRLVYDVIEEWHEEQAVSPAPVGESPDAQLAEGVQIGLQLAALRRDAERVNGSPKPEPAPAPCLAETQEECDALIAAAGAAAKQAVKDLGTRTRVRDAEARASTNVVHAPPPINTEVVSALGVEHTLVTLLQPRTLAEVDADEKRFAQLGSDEKAAQLRAIVNELRMLSAHGEMPSMADWDEKKPEDLPRATTLLQRHKLSWGRLAEYADLGFDLNERRGRRHNREGVAA